MSRTKLLRMMQLAVLSVLACGSGQPPVTGSGNPGGAHLEVAVSGLDSPVYLAAPAGDGRLFIVEQAGRIRVVRNGSLQDQPFLDIRAKVKSGGEQGLLSVAFHPQFAQNGFLFVNYTDVNGDTRVERYQATPNSDVANANSAKLILAVDQPYSNHNGGLVLFGPDGMLYIGMGDGGSGGDPHANAQNPTALLGKLLRINVAAGDPYAVPADNPYAGQAGYRGEIWASGMRNPWRFAFDRAAQLLYVADVGQNRWEEIDIVPAHRKGVNYGWNVMEGSHCYLATTCSATGLVQPALEYGHDAGCSVTGGFVYRGAAMPDLRGTYFYADYCKGWVRSFKYVNGAVTEQRTWDFGDIGNVLSFGEDAAGELYILSSNGKAYRLAR